MAELHDQGDKWNNIGQMYTPYHSLAELVHAQTQDQIWLEEPGFDVTSSQGVTTLGENNHTRLAGSEPLHFRASAEQFIRGLLIGGFQKCLSEIHKFQPDPERRFAVIFKYDRAVEKWLKPAKGQCQVCQVHCRHEQEEHAYEPNFAAETTTKKLLREPKRITERDDEVVQIKEAAVIGCQRAAEHARKYGAKPWSYLLILHAAVKAAAQYRFEACGE